MVAYSERAMDGTIRAYLRRWLNAFRLDLLSYGNESCGITSTVLKNRQDEADVMINKIRESIIVTGGCFTSMLLGEKPNDIDVYFSNFQVAEQVASLYIQKMINTEGLTQNGMAPVAKVVSTDEGIQIYVKSQGIAAANVDNKRYTYFEMFPYVETEEFFKKYRKQKYLNGKKLEHEVKDNNQITFLTSNAITLNNGVQLITRFVGSPEKIHQYFDFVHATNYWTYKTGMVYQPKALKATLEKRLYYFGSKFPVASIFRMKKFVERGWIISAGDQVKIMFDISKLDLTDIKVLKEQSMGMDSAYFSQVISKLLENRTIENADSLTIDRSYLFQCIDEAFGIGVDRPVDIEDDETEEEFSLDSLIENQ